jgi:hypothetical protein
MAGSALAKGVGRKGRWPRSGQWAKKWRFWVCVEAGQMEGYEGAGAGLWLASWKDEAKDWAGLSHRYCAHLVPGRWPTAQGPQHPRGVPDSAA